MLPLLSAIIPYGNDPVVPSVLVLIISYPVITLPPLDDGPVQLRVAVEVETPDTVNDCTAVEVAA